MKIFYNTNFKGYYPVGVSAVVVAETKEIAAKELENSLDRYGLNQDVSASDMIEIPKDMRQVYLLNNGDY